MKITNSGSVPVYTIAGSSTSRPLPEWLARKRRRSLKKDPEFANRVELLQDFEFEEASSCVRISEDGDWLMSTGTYKPQIHVHHLPQLSLSFARHTDALNQKFVLLSSDYTKSLHLQSDRFLAFQSPGGLHYQTRIPRYGRDLVYVNRAAEALVPAVGVNEAGNGEVFRLNLELGRFMKGYEVDVGGGVDGRVDGPAISTAGMDSGAVNCAAVAEMSHNVLAFGTSTGTVEFWDPRSRSRVAILPPPQHYSIDAGIRPGISALEFHSSGLKLASGTNTGLVSIYDLRSTVPLIQREQGYDEPIQNLRFLESSLASNLIMSSDKRIIKLWHTETGDAFTSVEPAVDLNHVEWVPKTGMFLTANEGRQQHAFHIPQLGPAPRWCSFLDNLVEEMAEDGDDPNAFKTNGYGSSGAVYDNYKFLSVQQLRELNMDHLIGQTSLLRPYMHGYFVAQKLYEQARLISNPLLFEQEREKSIAAKIASERESRVRGSKAVQKVKVNRRLAERMAAREEANERRKARRVLRQGGDLDVDGSVAGSDVAEEPAANDENDTEQAIQQDELIDPRFASLFQNEDFEIDEESRAFALQNPATAAPGSRDTLALRRDGERTLTAAEQEEADAQDLRRRRGTSASDDDDDDDSSGAEDGDVLAQRTTSNARSANGEGMRISNTEYGKAGKRRHGEVQQQRERERDREKDRERRDRQRGPKMVVRSSTGGETRAPQRRRADESFGVRVAENKSHGARSGHAGKASDRGGEGGVVGERHVTFQPGAGRKMQQQRRRRDGDADAGEGDTGRKQSRGQRRSASGNVFRNM